MVAKDITTTEAAGRVGIGRRSAALGLAGALAGLTGAVSATANEKRKVKKSKKKPKKTPAGLIRRFALREESFTVAARGILEAPVMCRDGTAKEQVVAVSGGFTHGFAELGVIASHPAEDDLAGWRVTFTNTTNAAHSGTVYVRCAYFTK